MKLFNRLSARYKKKKKKKIDETANPENIIKKNITILSIAYRYNADFPFSLNKRKDSYNTDKRLCEYK